MGCSLGASSALSSGRPLLAGARACYHAQSSRHSRTFCGGVLLVCCFGWSRTADFTQSSRGGCRCGRAWRRRITGSRTAKSLLALWLTAARRLRCTAAKSPTTTRGASVQTGSAAKSPTTATAAVWLCALHQWLAVGNELTRSYHNLLEACSKGATCGALQQVQNSWLRAAGCACRCGSFECCACLHEAAVEHEPGCCGRQRVNKLMCTLAARDP